MHCQQSVGFRVFLTPHFTLIITVYFDVNGIFSTRF